MTLDEFRKAIEKREQFLLTDMDKNRSEARDLTDQGATEPMERMVNLEGRDSLLQLNDSDFHELTLVRAALERLDDGTFGKCIDCGKQIPQGRLEAIPWTEYCLDDQEKHERGGEQASRSLTL